MFRKISQVKKSSVKNIKSDWIAPNNPYCIEEAQRNANESPTYPPKFKINTLDDKKKENILKKDQTQHICT